MKFALFATAIVAVSAIRMERSLNGEAANEEDTWEAYQNAKKAVDAAEEVYITKKAAARATEVELQREINETIAQEKVVKKANKVADQARLSLYQATIAAHKAFSGYMKAMMADTLKYKK